MTWFQSTPPAWGATPVSLVVLMSAPVSIHAPRVGGDGVFGAEQIARDGFNPRPPRGGRLLSIGRLTSRELFQSTPPAWGATAHISDPGLRIVGFNPRPPRGGRHWSPRSTLIRSSFNPRPPRGGRLPQVCDASEFERFNPRPPRGGRHAKARATQMVDKGFNPRPPRGGRRHRHGLPARSLRFQSTPPAWGATFPLTLSITVTAFQSTPPAWGATKASQYEITRKDVSIHAPRVGGDSVGVWVIRIKCSFNPRPPRGGRQGDKFTAHAEASVSIHAPRVGGDSIFPSNYLS